MPIARCALVPVMKKPAGRNTIADVAIAPPPALTPLSPTEPVIRIVRPFAVSEINRVSILQIGRAHV